jgi:hypothetical protein
VSTLPVTLQLTVLAMDRGWESPVRMNGSFMTFSSFSGARDKDLTAHHCKRAAATKLCSGSRCTRQRSARATERSQVGLMLRRAAARVKLGTQWPALIIDFHL